MAAQKLLSFFPEITANDTVAENNPVSRIFSQARRIITTRKGTHFEDKEFGTDIHKLISIIDNVNISSLIYDEVIDSLNLYLPEYSYLITVDIVREKFVNSFYRIDLIIDSSKSSISFNSKTGRFF